MHDKAGQRLEGVEQPLAIQLPHVLVRDDIKREALMPHAGVSSDGICESSPRPTYTLLSPMTGMVRRGPGQETQ